jgi:hypothetical protein
MSNNIDYLDLINSYITAHPYRQQEYFKFLHDNQSNSDVNYLSYRFLRAEYLQAKCSSFKVIP